MAMAPGASRTGWIERGESPVAGHWHALGEAGQVECTLCPRHCRPRPDQIGACGVRGNLRGSLHTFNYGRSVAATEEVIETEAIYHYSPGRRILSLGNVGCMMACSFCQNWQTSQVRHLNPEVVKTYSPGDVLDLCEEHGIDMISWTYNDPVVWHEFVHATSRLAHRRGLRTLYKSAFYIEEAPARELIDVVDIFSLSLKSMDETFYRRIAKGELAPVLERIQLVHRSGRHLEISQLVIPDLNDGLADIRKTIHWVLDHVGDDVPLHFVGFHPAYRYRHVERTPVETLLMAREEALAAGIRYCYLGNAYREGGSDTDCDGCGHTLVRRYGLSASVVGITPEGACAACGQETPIRSPFEAVRHVPTARGENAPVVVETGRSAGDHPVRTTRFRWTPEVGSVHLRTDGGSRCPGESFDVVVRHLDASRTQRLRLGGGLERAIVSRYGDRDRGILISWNAPHDVNVLPVLDRAHFPVDDETADPQYAHAALALERRT